MSSEMEGLLFFSVMALVLITTIIFTWTKIKKIKNLKGTMIQSLCLSLFLFSCACIWWFFQASDGFSQVFGGLLYGIAFILSSLVNIGLLFYMEKKSPE
jgi:hypothetical protein